MKHKISLSDMLAAFILIIYFAELVFPRINTFFSYTIVCLVCLMLWLFLASCSDTHFLLRKENFALLAIYLILVITPLIFGYSVISHRYANMGLVLCGSIIFNYYYSHDKLHILKKVLTVTLILALITMITTYGQLLINPFISRSIKSSGEYSAELASRGIGGYTFIYFITALSIVALYYALNCSQKKNRILAIVWYAFSLIFIIKSNYMTAFLSIILGSALLMFLTLSKGKNGILRGTVVAFAIFTVGMNLDVILSEIAPILPSRISRVLLSAEHETVFESISQEFTLDRWPTLMVSIDSFKQHPFGGLVGSGKLGFSGGYLTGVGQHSYILDTYALFGLIGGSINLFAVIRPLLNHKMWFHNATLRIPLLLCMVMLYFMNNATESIALVFTIIAPFVVCDTKKKDNTIGEKL